MTIVLGSSGDWYARQDEARHEAVQSVMAAMLDYERRKKAEAGDMLEYFGKVPGSTSGPMGAVFLQKYGDDPILKSSFSEAQRRDAMTTQLFSNAETARSGYQENLANTRGASQSAALLGAGGSGGPGIGGALFGAMAPAAEQFGQIRDEGLLKSFTEDPTGFQQAFAQTPANDRYSVAQEMQRLNMPLTRLLPDASPDPLVSLAATGQIDPSTAVRAERAKLGLEPTPAWYQQREYLQSDQQTDRTEQSNLRREEEDIRFGHQKTLKGIPQARAAGTTGGLTAPQKLAAAKDAILGGIGAKAMPPEVASDERAAAEWKSQNSAESITVQRKVNALAQKARNTGVSTDDLAKAVARLQSSKGLTVVQALDQMSEALDKLAGGSGVQPIP